MWLSNLRNNILLTVAFGSLLITGCKNASESENAEAASFFTSSIEGTSEVSKTDLNYGLPVERLYNFKVCVKDIMQSKAIPGHRFDIYAENNELKGSPTSDEQGCLNWSEKFPYNFVSDSKYIELKRTVFANGIHSGNESIKIAINPWSHGENTTQAQDPNKKSISSLKKVNNEIQSFTKNESTALWSMDPRVTIFEKELKSSGAILALKFQTKLGLMLKNTANQNVYHQLNEGKFNIDLTLFNTVKENGVETHQKIARIQESNLSFTQDAIILEKDFQLTFLPTRGQIYLLAEITPAIAHPSLTAFRGTLLVSDKAQIKTESRPTLSTELNYSELFNSLNENDLTSNSNINTDKSQNPKSEKPGLEVEKLEIKFLKIGQENTTSRQVYFNIKACIKNNLDASPIRFKEFSVSTINAGKSQTLESNQLGCISWDDSLWHKFFDKERFFKTKVSIVQKDLGLNITIPLQINPWETNSNIGRDERFVEDFGSMTNSTNEETKIIIDDYNFNVTNYRYEVGNALNLTLVKSGTLAFDVNVHKPSSTSLGRMEHTRLRDGKYALRWAIVQLNQLNKIEDIVSSGEKIVQSYGGEIKTDVDFKISLFKTLRERSTLIISVYTINEAKLKSAGMNISKAIDSTSGLKATPHMGQIVLDQNRESQKMFMVDGDLGLGKGDLLQKVMQKHAENSVVLNSDAAKTNLTQNILSKNGFSKINLAVVAESENLRIGLTNPTKFETNKKAPNSFNIATQKPGYELAKLQAMISAGKLNAEIAPLLCDYWFKDLWSREEDALKKQIVSEQYANSLAQNCKMVARTNPNAFFATEKKLVVKNVGAAKYLGGSTYNLNVGTSFSMSKSKSVSKSLSWSWNNTLGLKFDLFGIFNFGSNVGMNLSHTTSNSEGHGTDVRVQASQNLTVQESQFSISINQYDECLAVSLNPTLFSGANASYKNIWLPGTTTTEATKITTKGLFLCKGLKNTTPIQRTEKYYFISQESRLDGGIQDYYSLDNNQLFMSFRGQKDFTNFVNYIQGSLQTPGSDVTKNFEQVQKNVSQGFRNLPTWPSIYSEI